MLEKKDLSIFLVVTASLDLFIQGKNVTYIFNMLIM